MAKQWQLRRGTTVENDDFTGAVGEVTVDTVTHELRVHDGSAEGGYIVGETSKQVLNQNTLSTTEKVKTWMGSEAEYEAQDIENEHPDYVCYITDDEPADSQEYNLVTYPMRNVGDVFFTSRLDTELNGAVECDGSTYYLSNYQGIDSIYNLFTLGKLEYISMSDYADDITNKGWCDKFGWDGEGNDEFKVPTLSAKVIQENNIPVIGTGMTLGLTDGNANFGLFNGGINGYSVTGASISSYGKSIGNVGSNNPGANTSIGVTTDPEKSGLIASSAAVSADLRVMIQLAEACLDDTIEKNSYDLFDVKWTDHTISNIAWTRADTFDWKDGRIYTTAYNHLKSDYDNIEKATYYFWASASHDDRYCWTESRYPEVGDTIYYDVAQGLTGEVTGYDSTEDVLSFSYDGHNWSVPYVEEVHDGVETETISGTTIEYYLAEDGHKIVLPDQETNVSSIYTATGIAWYYILDIENERFKLPRTKFAFAGIRDTVGKYIEPGLPNLSSEGDTYSSRTGAMVGGSNLFKASSTSYKTGQGSGDYNLAGWGFSFDASRYNSIYGNSDTVQSPATQMYLYFYLGEFTNTSLKNAATLNIETLNKKVEKGHEVVEFQIPTAENDYTWVRKYADGWVEQGGKILSITEYQVTLPITMADTYYTVIAQSISSATSKPSDTNTANHNTVFCYSRVIYDIKTTGFKVYNSDEMSQNGFSWQVSGMAA